MRRMMRWLAMAALVVAGYAATPVQAQADVIVHLPRLGVYVGDGDVRIVGRPRYHRPYRYYDHGYYDRPHYRPRYHRPFRPYRPLARAYRRGYRDGYYSRY